MTGVGVVVGVDFQSVDDIASSLQLFGSRFVRRVYDADEADHARRHPNTASTYLAGRFAAREAVLKLLEIEDVVEHWHNISIDSRDRCATVVTLSNDTMRRAQQRGVARIHLCIDSTANIAVAVALADVATSGEATS